VAALLLVVATAGTSAAAPRVHYRLPYGQVKVEPKRIEFSDLTITRISWRDWGERSSRGRGRVRINTCRPSCANGDIVRGTARLRMFRRHREGDRRFYGCMTGRLSPEGSQRVEWPPGCADR